MIADMLPVRRVDAHKGTFGKAMLVVGSANYTGAAYLAGTAATRAPRVYAPLCTKYMPSTGRAPSPMCRSS